MQNRATPWLRSTKDNHNDDATVSQVNDMDDLLKKAQEVAGKAAEIGKDVLKDVVEEGKVIAEKVKTEGPGVVEKVTTKTEEVVDKIVEEGKDVLGSMVEEGKEVVEKVKDFFDGDNEKQEAEIAEETEQKS